MDTSRLWETAVVRRECRCVRRSSDGRLLMISQLGARAGARVCFRFEGRSWRCGWPKRCRGSESTELRCPDGRAFAFATLGTLLNCNVIPYHRRLKFLTFASMMLGHDFKSVSHLDLHNADNQHSTSNVSNTQHPTPDTSQPPLWWLLEKNPKIWAMQDYVSFRNGQGKNDGPMLPRPYSASSSSSSPPHHFKDAAPRVYRHFTRPSP